MFRAHLLGVAAVREKEEFDPSFVLRPADGGKV
jgi:hypothetical protein